jgi:hypothetical protein
VITTISDPAGLDELMMIPQDLPMLGVDQPPLDPGRWEQAKAIARKKLEDEIRDQKNKVREMLQDHATVKTMKKEASDKRDLSTAIAADKVMLQIEMDLAKEEDKLRRLEEKYHNEYGKK